MKNTIAKANSLKNSIALLEIVRRDVFITQDTANDPLVREARQQIQRAMTLLEQAERIVRTELEVKS